MPNMTRPEPHQYPRRILLAVAANSPQIVTETIYALARQSEPACIPTEVHIITTGRGEPYVCQLLDAEQPGWLNRLCSDYRLPVPQCDSSHIHLITDAEQRILPDIRTRSDNTHAADFITRTVRELTADPDSSLIVSLSGGRRTMTFYAGHALSLFGRVQDRLTHVLVDDEYFFNAEFFYPPPQPVWVMRDDNSGFDASRVEVTLADIPFVRLRDSLPPELMENQTRYSEVVAAAQAGLGPPQVQLNIGKAELHCGTVSISMKPVELAFYYWFLKRRMLGLTPIRWCDNERRLAGEFLQSYADLFGNTCAEYERIAAALSAGMTKEYFESRKSRTNTALKKGLNKNVASNYVIESFGKRPETRFGVSLDSQSILLKN
ncbi:MAG: CRISPR-associated ring nuclease Csm6 [Thiolinea sp.]